MPVRGCFAVNVDLDLDAGESVTRIVAGCGDADAEPDDVDANAEGGTSNDSASRSTSTSGKVLFGGGPELVVLVLAASDMRGEGGGGVFVGEERGKIERTRRLTLCL